MALCPFAVLRLLPANETSPRIVPRVVIWHTAVDGAKPNGSLWGDFTSRKDGIESHFWIRNDGGLEQYMDTERRADANLDANGFAVSVETEDDGNPVANPWTPEQIATIVRLALWLHEVHGIPLTVAESPTGSGQGWHAMWGAPSAWTPSRGKTCPGPTRIAQLRTTILPALAAGTTTTSEEDPFMAELSSTEIRDFYTKLVHLHDRVFGVTVPGDDAQLMLRKDGGEVVRVVNAIADKLGADIGAVRVSVAADQAADAAAIAAAVLAQLGPELAAQVASRLTVSVQA